MVGGFATEEGATWDYEEDEPPFYHVFSSDGEPEELGIGPELFRIVTPSTAEMDARIEDLCNLMEDIIATAAAQLEAKSGGE